MSGNELIELKKQLLKRVLKIPKTCWDGGKCNIEEDNNQNVSGIIVTVRRTKRKNEPFAIDVKFLVYNQHEELACEVRLDYIVKMI